MEKRRILVVDDEFAVRQLAELALRADGYRVSLADSSEVALELLRGPRFDAALLDINLGRMDGLELHRRIRGRDPALARRTLFMSGTVQPEAAFEYITTCSAGFIEKPFGPADLIRAVRRILARPTVRRGTPTTGPIGPPGP